MRLIENVHSRVKLDAHVCSCLGMSVHDTYHGGCSPSMPLGWLLFFHFDWVPKDQITFTDPNIKNTPIEINIPRLFKSHMVGGGGMMVNIYNTYRGGGQTMGREGQNVNLYCRAHVIAS